ncbi:cytochrome P450 [Streptomyces sp. NPDC005374]|uniref:cytochrome P450 n=1 Tax=Streptomyces sp. NPDC005374 TaxID=3364713 RepID=UPI0036894CDC
MPTRRNCVAPGRSSLWVILSARCARWRTDTAGSLWRILPLQSANSDPAVFDLPDRLDLGRDARRHVAFGYGVHQCLGQPLARVELQIALPALLARFPGLRVAVPAEEIVFQQGTTVHGVHELPVSW